MTPSPLLLPTAYCPPIAYFAYIAGHDAIVIEQHETFPKQTYRNRTLIMTANGILPLSVPAVRTNGNHTTTAEIGITYAEHWNIQHWRAIESAYNASPYFLYYRDGLEQILLTQHAQLIDLNQQLLQFFLKKLKIPCAVSYSADYARPDSIADDCDLRQRFSPKKKETLFEFPAYEQVFSAKFPFTPDLSIIDLLFNLGPDSKEYISSLSKQIIL